MDGSARKVPRGRALAWPAAAAVLAAVAAGLAWGLPADRREGTTAASPASSHSGAVWPISPRSYLAQAAYVRSIPACDKYASTLGADTNPGTRARPYRTLHKLADSLAPGQAGCLKGDGTFVEKFSISTGGIKLRTDPSYTRASLRGRLEVKNTANDVTVEDLAINGDNSDLGRENAVQVFGDRFRLSNSDITGDDSSGARSCIILGAPGQGYANEPVIERNRIHDCGTYADNLEHGIYVANSRRAVIRDNYIYGNDGGWGIHVYPDADDSRIEHNTVDGNRNGILIAGEDTLASDGNVLRNNIVSNTYEGYNVSSWWDGSVPSGNTVDRFCVWNGSLGDVEGAGTAYEVTNSLRAAPRYVDRAAKDFRLRAGSSCAGRGVR